MNALRDTEQPRRWPVRRTNRALPVARPFAQVMVTLGPIDLVTLGGGIQFDLGGG